MSHNPLTNSEPNTKANAAGVERSLSLLCLPLLFGLVTLRQVERQWGQLGQFAESLLQGEQLPILDRRCSSAQNRVDL
jgi:hypothetical protein